MHVLKWKYLKHSAEKEMEPVIDDEEESNEMKEQPVIGRYGPLFALLNALELAAKARRQKIQNELNGDDLNKDDSGL